MGDPRSKRKTDRSCLLHRHQPHFRGNSGSPVINEDGNPIGINFDRVWEGTMSDIVFDPDYCRNISLDIRYVLFTIDKLAGAGHLLDEMVFAK